ncbi:MAG: BRO family protein [Candidatus Fonsibacter sp.]
MSEITELNFNNNTFTCIVINGDPWFRGKDIAKLLDYADTAQAIAKKNVSKDDRKKMEELMLTCFAIACAVSA